MKRTSRRDAGILIAVSVILAAGFTIGMYQMYKEQSPVAELNNEANETVHLIEGFIDAVKSEDIERIASLLADSSPLKKDYLEFGGEKLFRELREKLVVVDEGGERSYATHVNPRDELALLVTVTWDEVEDPNKDHLDFQLRKEDGKWKIESIS